MKNLSVSKNPNIFFWASLISGINLLAPVSTLFNIHRGLQYSDFFTILLIIVITMFFSEVPTGIFADKYGPKASMITGQILAILSSILLIFADTKIEFYFIAFLTGIIITFFSGCDEAFIYDSLKQERKEKDMSHVWGKIQSGAQVAGIIGVITGAIIAKDLVESQFLILIYSGIFFSIIKLILLFSLTNPKKHLKKLDRQNPFHHLKEGIAVLRRHPALLLLFMSETLVFIPLHVFNIMHQPFLKDLGFPIVALGILYAINSIISYILLRNMNFIKSRFDTKKILSITAIGIFFSYVVAIFTNSIYLAIAIFFVLKLGNTIRAPIFSQIKNEYIDSKSRATTLSLLSMIDSFFDVIVFSSLAFVANQGLSVIFLGSAIVVFIGLMFPVKLFKEEKASF